MTCANPATCANPGETEAAQTGVAAQPMTWKDGGHMALDAAGMAPGVGEIADGVNAVWYAAEGDWGNALISLSGAVPFVGSAGTGGRLAAKGEKLIEGLQTGKKAFKKAPRSRSSPVIAPN